ncbi:protein of unknown function [Serratia sp. Tan611]|nr:protein of unknown function [Serratia sp. Tan611]
MREIIEIGRAEYQLNRGIDREFVTARLWRFMLKKPATSYKTAPFYRLCSVIRHAQRRK